MKKKSLSTNKQIVKLTTKHLIDALADLISVPFTASSLYKVTSDKLLQNQEIRKIDFSKQLYEIKRRGYVDSFVGNKEGFLEVTPKLIRKIVYSQVQPIQKPKQWDKKWRIVMFDIPEPKKIGRNAFRREIHQLGFIQIQKSVYVHPFQCTKQIQVLSSSLDLSDYVKIMISEIIQGEDELIIKFLDKNVLNQSDLV